MADLKKIEALAKDLRERLPVVLEALVDTNCSPESIRSFDNLYNSITLLRKEVKRPVDYAKRLEDINKQIDQARQRYEFLRGESWHDANWAITYRRGSALRGHYEIIAAESKIEEAQAEANLIRLRAIKSKMETEYG